MEVIRITRSCVIAGLFVLFVAIGCHMRPSLPLADVQKLARSCDHVRVHTRGYGRSEYEWVQYSGTELRRIVDAIAVEGQLRAWGGMPANSATGITMFFESDAECVMRIAIRDDEHVIVTIDGISYSGALRDSDVIELLTRAELDKTGSGVLSN